MRLTGIDECFFIYVSLCVCESVSQYVCVCFWMCVSGLCQCVSVCVCVLTPMKSRGCVVVRSSGSSDSRRNKRGLCIFYCNASLIDPRAGWKFILGRIKDS